MNIMLSGGGLNDSQVIVWDLTHIDSPSHYVYILDKLVVCKRSIYSIKMIKNDIFCVGDTYSQLFTIKIQVPSQMKSLKMVKIDEIDEEQKN